MMPYVDDEIDVGDEDVETPASAQDYPIEGEDVEYDIAAHDIVLGDGEIETIYDEDALEQWIKKVLLTRAHVDDIYKLTPEDEEPEDDEEEEDDEDAEPEDETETDEDDIEDEDDEEEPALYGTAIFDIFYDTDASDDYKFAEIERLITEAITEHPDVVDVGDFTFKKKKRHLKITFTVTSIYGTLEEGVKI